MSHNPAWHAYNDKVEEINAEYEKTVRPLRLDLSEDLKDTEQRFDEKIRPLEVERDAILAKAKKAYTEAVEAATDKRTAALKRAVEVRNAEIAASKKEPAKPAAAAPPHKPWNKEPAKV